MNFRELLAAGWKQVQPDTELSGNILANLYTNLNLDARFTPLGKGQWGLTEWQPRPARSTIPTTSLIGKTYENDRRPERTKLFNVDIETEDASVSAEELLFPIEDDEEEEWDEQDDQD